MTTARMRAVSAVVAAAACAAALTMTPAFQSGVRALMAEVGLVDNVGFIMGGTGNPLPDDAYVNAVETLYLNEFANSGYTFQPLFTPEEFCPIVCVAGPPDLTFGESLTAGVGNLDDAIIPALQAGDNVSVLGYSQSAVISTIEMNNLLSNTPDGVDLSQLHFTLLGDPSSPIGGILDRFQFPEVGGEAQHVPFLDIPLSLGVTPTDGIDTDIYTAEYDGFADFPRDISNIYAVTNALIGIQTVHPYYPFPEPGVNLDTTNIIDLGTIDGGDTNFYAIPAPLPTLAFLYDGGPVGRIFYDSLSPQAILTTNWAYGNPGDPGAGLGIVGADPIGEIGPWQVNAYGELMDSGVIGFFLKMDPLQMLAGMEYASAQSIIGPMNDVLALNGQAPLSDTVIDSLLAGYNYTNELDTAFLTELATLATTFPSLDPEVLFDGAPLVSGQPLLDFIGNIFDIFNNFSA